MKRKEKGVRPAAEKPSVKSVLFQLSCFLQGYSKALKAYSYVPEEKD